MLSSKTLIGFFNPICSDIVELYTYPKPARFLVAAHGIHTDRSPFLDFVIFAVDGFKGEISCLAELVDASGFPLEARQAALRYEITSATSIHRVTPSGTNMRFPCLTRSR